MVTIMISTRSTARSLEDLLERPGTLISIVFVLGMVACDRDDLTSGSKLTNDESVDPEPCQGGDCEEPLPPLPEGVKIDINEIMVENTSTIEDQGEFSPWVELYNESDLEVNLAGVLFSDDLLQPDKWAIPAIPEAVVEPFGYLIIFCDGDEDNPDDLHANFTLTRGFFTTLVLDGGNLDLILGLNTTTVPADISIGRFPDGEEGLEELEEPTPGLPNAPPGGEPPPPQEAEFIRGDVTEDNVVTVSDMVGIQLILAGEEPLPDCEDRADANDDGVIDDLDPVAVGNAVFKQQPLPPPYLDPGVDPTADDLSCEVR